LTKIKKYGIILYMLFNIKNSWFVFKTYVIDHRPRKRRQKNEDCSCGNRIRGTFNGGAFVTASYCHGGGYNT
jgi:hypothetical protein